MVFGAFRFGIVAVAAALLAACGGGSTPPVSDGQAFSRLRSHSSSSTDESVAYQVNAEHSGFVRSVLHRPLKQLWSVNLGGKSGGGVGYPVVANGIVVVVADNNLVALDEKTGKQLWTQGSPSGDGWVGPAYDNGAIFVDPFEQLSSSSAGMYAFEEKTGKQLWSAPAPGQVFFSSPPTAASGVVYTGAAGVGGTIYAYDESTGVLKWMVPVNYGGMDSSPVVTATGIYVSGACPQTYDLKPDNGKQIWHFNGPCEGGGGSTPVLYNELLFVGDSQALSGYNGLILKAKNGTIAGGFNAYYTPAFAYKRGFFVSGSTLEALAIPRMTKVWTAGLTGSDSYVTPPLVVGRNVYIETSSGTLKGYDVNDGKQQVKIQLGNGGFYRGVPVGLGYGDGELIVPNGSYLFAFKGQ